MTDADDNVVELRDVDHVFEQILAGELAAPDAPAWCGDVARLVAGAQAAPTGDELAAEDDVVRAMAELRRAARTGPAATGTPDDATDALVDLWSTPDRPAGADAAPGPDGAPVEPAQAETPVRRLPAAGDVRPGEAIAAGRRRRGPRHVTGRPRHAVGSTAGTGARQVGRLLAAKTAAVTTAVVVGTVAAAAATTGIVSGFVMPTLAGRVVKTPSSSTVVYDDGEASTRPGDTLPEGLDIDDETVVTTPSCPTLVLVCSPLTPAGESAPGTGGAATRSPAKSGATGLSSSTTTTTAPSAPAPTEATTTTTVPDTPPPTEPEPTTTTSTTVPDTPPPTDPEPVGTFSVPDPAAQLSP